MSTSNDDEDGSNLDGMMEAMLLDDLGGSSVFIGQLVDIFRSWDNSRDNNRSMGRSKDLGTVQMVGQKTEESEVGMSTLPKT